METTETNSPEATTAEVAESTETEESSQQEMTTEEVETIESPATYADGKFNSVGDLEKSYLELQSTFSKKMGAFSGAPEAYEFREGAVSEENQDLANMLGEWGKDNQMSNEGLNSLIGQYNEFQAQQHDAKIDAEFKKLGENANDRITSAKSYLEANIGVEATEALAANMNTAAAIEAVERLISLNKSQKPADLVGDVSVNKEKIREMRFAVDEHGQRKMEDPAYRQRVLKLEAGLVS